MARKKSDKVNPKKAIIEQMAEIVAAAEKAVNEAAAKCEKLSEEHGIPFSMRLTDGGGGNAYFPKKIDRVAIEGTEFDGLGEYLDSYEGEGWSNSWC